MAQDTLTDDQSQIKVLTDRFAEFQKRLDECVKDRKKTGWIRITAHYSNGRVTGVQVAQDDKVDPLSQAAKQNQT